LNARTQNQRSFINTKYKTVEHDKQLGENNKDNKALRDGPKYIS